jgi:hypothetical protein
MSALPTNISRLLLNGSIVLLGLCALVLIYALVTRTLSSSAMPERDEQNSELVGDIIQVEVLNGCGEVGIAGQTTRYLRQNGFDVVGSGNYADFNVTESFVLDRVGHLESARRLARSLGIAEDRVKQELNPDLYLDASVVLGKDFQKLTAFQE